MVSNGLNVLHFRDLIVRPTVQALGMYNETIVDILTGTAVHESKLHYLKQSLERNGDARGRARGVYQIEPDTAQDVMCRYVDEVIRPAHRARVNRVLGAHEPTRHSWSAVGKSGGINGRLIYDLLFQTTVARLIYWMEPTKLPEYGDIEGYANYWSRYFNTGGEAGKEAAFRKSYRKRVAPVVQGKPLGQKLFTPS